MTISTPPAWHFLHECDAPVTMEELSVHSHNLPVAATLGAQTDSDQCANGEQSPPSAPIPSDQCDECRAAPGQPHATGCEGTAQLTDEQSCAAREHPAWVCFDCGKDRYGKPNALLTWTMGQCDICGKMDAVTEPRDFGGYHSVAPTVDFYTAAAHVRDARLGPGGSDVSRSPVISCDRKHDNLDDEPSLVKVESCPECGSVTDIEYEDAGPDTFSVPFKTQEFMFEELAEVQAEYLHDILKDHTPLIVEMARDRFRKGYAKYGSAAYQWDAETRLTNVLEELADSVVYLTTGAIE